MRCRECRGDVFASPWLPMLHILEYEDNKQEISLVEGGNHCFQSGEHARSFRGALHYGSGGGERLRSRP